MRGDVRHHVGGVDLAASERRFLGRVDSFFFLPKSIILSGSFDKTLYRTYSEPRKKRVLVVEGILPL